ncbi:SCO family protein [Acetobacter sp. AN02]|uniref:SCO family protein n=1 Tax=Acetobacter sp. AN02 TaxID=2894186 RepID=UPI0024341B9B|nr:SCO family protein [Acetobacter sp. AN02]MDG6094657.1 SCO family protein [Acetobacter sp. AN02]
MKTRDIRVLVTILAVVFLSSAGGYLAFRYSETMGPVVGSDGNEVGGRFRLMDASDGTMSDRDFRGRWMLVLFGATHCYEQACDKTLNTLSKALKTIDPDGKKTVPMFLSLDPLRDSSERLRQYALRFPAKIVAGTGAPANIAAVAKEFYAPIVKHPDPEWDYTFEMSPQIVVMNPQGHYAGLISSSASADEIRTRLETMMSLPR